MTDKKKPLDNDQQSAAAQPTQPVVVKTLSSNNADDSNSKDAKKVNTLNKEALRKDTLSKSTANKSTDNKKMNQTTKPLKQNNQSTAKISKTALSALFIGIISAAGVTAHFYWQTQQNQLLKQELLQKNSKANNAVQQKMQQQVQQLLASQKQTFSAQLEQMAAKVQRESMTKIAQLETTVSRLSQNKPSDWLIHEAEYLVRIAARTMWLERDTQAAIGLLNDADNRLQELNSPKFLPVRQLINQDIEQLRLMPHLQNEKIILTLMGLNQQIANLPLAIVDIDNQSQKKSDIELSSNIADWQENLAKSWRKFLDTFVVIHTRDGNLEPLLSPSQQKNLRENLSLKLQQAQWAVREEKTSIYQQTLTDSKAWLNQYFDISDKANQNFIDEIENLKTETISFDYPSTLSSLPAMRALIEQQTSSAYFSDKKIATETVQIKKEPTESTNKTEPNNNKIPKITIEQQLHQEELKQQTLDEAAKSTEDNL